MCLPALSLFGASDGGGGHRLSDGKGAGRRSFDEAATPEAPLLTQGRVVYTELRERIIRLELAPGSGVSEAKLARLLPSGPGPVRYALQRLSAERLLNVRPRGQTMVSTISITEVGQSYGVRTYLEILAARRAARYGPLSSLDRLVGFVAEAEAAVAAQDHVRVFDVSRLYWSELVSSAQSEVLTQALAPVMAITERFEYYLCTRLQRQMFDIDLVRKVSAAARARDPDTAGTLTAKHLGDMRERICLEFVNITLV